MDRLTAILQRQLQLQNDYGYNYPAMTTEQRVATIKDMYIAAVQELGEVLNETTWKPWTSSEPNVHATHLIGELVDTFQFMMNMLFVARPDLKPEELSALFDLKHQQKVEVNRHRMASGYDGVSTKCKVCGRALDDVDVKRTYEDGVNVVRCSCDVITYDTYTSA